ncbi:MAG: hypothetical protein LC799_09445 [Actinobacteria bacterium]|nr:hypothetical protein [Actinomycetota bacterium]
MTTRSTPPSVRGSTTVSRATRPSPYSTSSGHPCLRLVTNRRIFEVPTPLSDAFAFIDVTCAQPHHVLLTPGTRHLALLRRCCEEADAVGDLVPDAVLVALAVEHGCAIVTLDRDFARFESIRHRRPELSDGS